MKTEPYSPEQEVHVNAKVIDSSQVTVKSELYLPEQVIHMNTEVTDSTQIAKMIIIRKMNHQKSWCG